MNGSEGLRRIAVVIRVIGWIWAVALILVASSTFFGAGGRPTETGLIVGCLIFAVVGWLCLRGIAWIVDGLASPKKAS